MQHLLYFDQASSTGKSGPEMMALITPLPSSLFPARVALNATIASLKWYLTHAPIEDEGQALSWR
jgi:hypothetical protein